MQLNKKRNPDAVVINQYEQMPDKELFLKIRDDILHSRAGVRFDEHLATQDPEELLLKVDEYIRRVYGVSDEKINQFNEYFLEYIFHYHVLTGVINDEHVSDVKALAPNNIRIKRLGKRKTTSISFWSQEDFQGYIEMLCVKNGINYGSANKVQTFTDTEGHPLFRLRYDVVHGGITGTGQPYLHIRKIPKKKDGLEQLIEKGMLTKKMAEYLKKRIGQGYVVICGQNAAGKTNLLGFLLEEISHEESALVIEENEELSSDTHPDMMFEHISGKKTDPQNYCGLKELVINGLMMDIDNLIIGEIKGEEALYFISAALSGLKGMTTIHSSDAAGALDKLADYCMWEGRYSRDEVMKMLSCVKTIVYVEAFKICEIVENTGWNEEEKQHRLHVVYDRKKGVDQL